MNQCTRPMQKMKRNIHEAIVKSTILLLLLFRILGAPILFVDFINILKTIFVVYNFIIRIIF